MSDLPEPDDEKRDAWYRAIMNGSVTPEQRAEAEQWVAAMSFKNSALLREVLSEIPPDDAPSTRRRDVTIDVRRRGALVRWETTSVTHEDGEVVENHRSAGYTLFKGTAYRKALLTLRELEPDPDE